VKAPCDPPPCKAKATLRRSGTAFAARTPAFDGLSAGGAANKPNALSMDNAYRREITSEVILPIISASEQTQTTLHQRRLTLSS
jgi:hypothetical protein